MNQANKCNCQCGCGVESEKTNDRKKTLVIAWQRLITEGNTCPRCGSTEDELEKAVQQLNDKLGSLGFDIILEKTELSLDKFKKDPLRSNRILLNGKLLDDVINAKTGKSQCCDVCGDDKCRTVEIEEKSYEIIPAEIIVKAALKILDIL